MCGCEKHHSRRAQCTCICPEHRNFDRAYDLAMQRYDEIRALRAEVAALREFANPKPPKPEEPTGLGAVVEDADGYYWVYTGQRDIDDVRWWMCGTNNKRKFADLDAVRVLSEGVTP